MARPAAKGTIQSLDRGLEILYSLADGEMSVTEVGQRLKIDKSTAYRLLATLETRGFVTQNERNRWYRLGVGCLRLAGTVLRDLSVRQVGRPYIETLFDQTGETVFLGMLENENVVYVERVVSASPLAVTSEVGMRAPLHVTATAKAVVAHLPIAVQQKIVRSATLTSLTMRTMTNSDILLAHLNEVRLRGYAIDDEEYCLGIRCVAAPFFNHNGQVIGSLSVSGPVQRVTHDRVPHLANLVMEAARQLSRQLGFIEAAK